MAKETRMLKCEEMGKLFAYKGYGRPPKFCPDVAKARQVEQRKRAQTKAKAAKTLRKAA